MCTGTPVHYEQTVRKRVASPRAREEEAAIVHGCTGTL